MLPFKFKKLFNNDGRESSLTQYDLKKYARLATVEDVDPENGLCNIRWLDRPGIRKDVIITQNSPTNYSFPKKGSVVIVIFDKFDRAFITSYIPLGQQSKIKNLKMLPKFKEGETFFEAGNSYIHIKKNGDIILATDQGYMILDNKTNTLSQEFGNWKVDTDGVYKFSGVIKRYINTLGNKRVETIEKSDGNAFIEHILKVYETTEDNSNLLYNLTIGTTVDETGNILSRSGNSLSNTSNKQICVDLKLNNGIRFTIDKEGFLQIDNAKVFLNNPSVNSNEVDSDKSLTNNSNLGTRGQHVAREHDNIKIPFGTSYINSEHKGLESLSAVNANTFINLFKTLISTPGLIVGSATVVPEVLIPGLITNSEEFEGEITEGAENIQFGDD